MSLPPVVEYQFGEMLELNDGKICGQSSLIPLLTLNAYSYIRLLDHPNIIPSIPYAKYHLIQVIFHVRGHLIFLLRRAPGYTDKPMK